MFKIAVTYFGNNELHSLEVGYGVSALKKHDSNLSVHKIDESNIQTEIDSIASVHPNMIAIFLSYNCYDLLLELSSQLKSLLDDVFIVICHSAASCLAELLLKDNRCIDVAVIGEFENTLSELCALISEKKDYKRCKGIAYMNNGEYVMTDDRAISEIESISPPERDCFPNDTRFFHVYGSRGCEGRCGFCDRNILYTNTGGHGVTRFRDIDDVVREVDSLVERYNCKFVSFSDPTFCSTSNIIDRLEKLYSCLSQRNYWIQFSMNLRAEQITPEVVMCMNKLKNVGLGKVFIGIESFNEFDLKLYGKFSNAKSNVNAISVLQNINSSYDDYILRIEYGFINFNPYSNVEGLKNNLSNLRKCDVHIDPYIISSKLSLNYLTKLTKFVNKDSLFVKDISRFTVGELLNYRFEYRFINRDVQDIYYIILSCYKELKLRNINGSEFIRNRYYHYYGYDRIVEKFDITFREWLSVVNDFSCDLFEYIISSEQEYNDKLSRAISMCDEFKKQFITVDNNLRGIQQRAVLQLKKNDELIYYR
ncbi:coproporphyrinogen III oxidase [compost metagenome]